MMKNSQRSRVVFSSPAVVFLLSGIFLCGCVLDEGSRSRLPTSQEAKLRREVSKKVEESGFPAAKQTGAPAADSE